jgi:CRISPR-associated exonuclease Cas4
MLLRVSDLKQYAYCPRVVYYHYVLPVDSQSTFKMEYGRISEEQLEKLEKRRKFKRYGIDEGVRRFGKWVVSERLGLTGKIDLLIESGGRYYPVDFKMTDGGVRENHKLQLAAYGLILEDLHGAPVEQGFIYLTAQEEVVPVALDEPLRLKCTDALREIRRMIEEEWMPEAASQLKRCDDCEYRNYCRDIW